MDDFMDMCDDCHVNPAIVHLTHVENNEVQTFHLCEDCARERGIPFPDGDSLIKGLEALAGAAGASIGPAHVKVTLKPVKEVVAEERESEPEEPDIVCPNCKLKLSAFRSSGRLGCAECYGAFEEQVEKILVQVHGAGRHKGKVYGKAAGRRGGKRDMERLRRDLEDAVKAEEFERAAAIRDAMREMKREAK